MAQATARLKRFSHTHPSVDCKLASSVFKNDISWRWRPVAIIVNCRSNLEGAPEQGGKGDRLLSPYLPDASDATGRWRNESGELSSK